MKLTHVRVVGFRSIKEKVTLAVDGKMTVLIGANDNGKTNLLSAIQCLNDREVFDAGDRNWDLSLEQEPSIEWQFRLTSEERLKLLDILDSKLKDEGVTVIRDAGTFELKILFRPDITEQKEPLGALISSVLSLATVVTKGISGEDRFSIPEDVTFCRCGASREIDVRGSDVFGMEELQTELLKLRPRIELFKSVEQLMDVVTLAELEQPTQEFMQGIFRYAGLWDVRNTLFQQSPATTRQLERASEIFTSKIRSEWQQGEELTFRLNHAGQNGNQIELLIQDPAVAERFVRPSERSEGFSTFFKMSMRMLARTAANLSHRHIFLFDEPGTSLHPSGQVNLQRVFERLGVNNQVIYSTHSLFMVNHNRPERNRVIAKGSSGTKVDQKPFLRNWRAVRHSLGLILAGTFFIADRTLLVEGESDALYLGALLAAYDRIDLIDVDLNLFSVQWAGNARDFEPMARLLIDEGRMVVGLVDGDKGGRDLKKRIDKLNAMITSGETLLEHPVAVIELPRDKSIEDLLPDREGYFASVVAAAHELVGGKFRSAADPAVPEDQMLQQLRADQGAKTLGKHVEQVSRSWFAEKESLSKLSVARHYCARLEENGLAKATPLDESIRKIAEALKLETKASEKAVFEVAIVNAQAAAAN